MNRAGNKLGAELKVEKGPTQTPLAVPPLCLTRVTGLNPRGKGLPFRQGFLQAIQATETYRRPCPGEGMGVLGRGHISPRPEYIYKYII